MFGSVLPVFFGCSFPAFSGIKLFECEICKSRFSSNVAMKEHMARHTDTRSYQCPVCNRLFRQNSCLRRHMVTHSSETPFDCPICHRKFSQQIYLRSHMRMHTGGWSYHYRKTSSISHTKSQNLNVSCILLKLSSLNPLKPGPCIKLRIKM